MQILQKLIQMKAGRLCNVTKAGLNFQNVPVYELGSKALEVMFKTYSYELSEGENPLCEPTPNGTVKPLAMGGESKAGLSTYYIKFNMARLSLMKFFIGLDKWI